MMKVWATLGVILLNGVLLNGGAAFAKQSAAEQNWGPSIRVHLKSLGTAKEVFLSSKEGFEIYDGETGETLARCENGKQERVSFDGGRLKIGEDSTKSERKLYSMVDIRAKNEIIEVRASSIKRNYRGGIRVVVMGDSLQVINELPVELYLRGVVPCEMPFTWSKEALKAQAVAARTFAYSRMIHERKTPYDLDDTTSSQVYRGYDVEKESTNEAISETAHLVLIHQGKPISALYCADCGGVTESASEVFSSDVPYLVSVLDADVNGNPFNAVSKYDSWSLLLGDKELLSLLEKRQVAIGMVREIVIVQRSSSGRVKEMLLRGEKGEQTLRGVDFRNLMGVNKLRSTLFEVNRVEDGWQFEGKGWGHGVGMCQVGAQSRAMAGYDFAEILSAYYRGAELKQAEVALFEPLSRRKISRTQNRDKRLPKKGG
ncbi:MAG TPA: SpoIID/LytB domain-containing protein [Fimbriimonadales bacterium]|nr:SpoIID/LytB domain-containing protein [Fimbriimonadales bacterium]